MPTITLAELQRRPTDWDKLFPKKTADVKADAFELGLVLGGTVSAGAYTAGVIDFLVEALDCWAAAKASGDKEVPSWDTRLKVVTGTSGGGVIAAILGRALSYNYPPIRISSDEATQQRNPFYKVWVKDLDIRGMLDTGDLAVKPLKSVLNGAPLESAACYIANYAQRTPGIAAKPRAYVDNPLPVFLTLSNLRGIPRSIEFGADGLSQRYIDHADHVRFAIFSQGGGAAVRPDEFGVSDTPGQSGFIGWDEVSQYALATGAFPVGLPLRARTRPLSHYRYRALMLPDDDVVYQAKVDWPQIIGEQTVVDDNYAFLCADGGVTDNEPIELCRRQLAGMSGRNSREGSEAQRGVLLIDPFAETPALGDETFQNLGKSISGLVGALKNQARYATSDLLLAARPDCFSRYMITARRAGLVGGHAIATASVGAFGGFLCEAYRRHDFLLGRKNCQEYLRTHLIAHKDNPTFAAWVAASPDSLAEHVILDKETGVECLPLIPLYGRCRETEQAESWPKGAFDPDERAFQKALKKRANCMLDQLTDALPGGNPIFMLGLNLVKNWGDGKLTEVVTEALHKELGAAPDGWDLLR